MSSHTSINSLQPHEDDDCIYGISLANGPYDDSEDYDRHIQRISCGNMDIPYVEGMELIPACDSNGICHGLSVVIARQCVELAVFAAPRSGGLWAQGFKDLKRDAIAHGFEVYPLTGRWGKELLLRPVGDHHMLPQRCVAIERQRWLIKATYIGACAEHGEQRAIIDRFISHIVVHRGKEARFPGELLPFELPESIREQLNSSGSNL